MGTSTSSCVSRRLSTHLLPNAYHPAGLSRNPSSFFVNGKYHQCLTKRFLRDYPADMYDHDNPTMDSPSDTSGGAESHNSDAEPVPSTPSGLSSSFPLAAPVSRTNLTPPFVPAPRTANIQPAVSSPTGLRGRNSASISLLDDDDDDDDENDPAIVTGGAVGIGSPFYWRNRHLPARGPKIIAFSHNFKEVVCRAAAAGLSSPPTLYLAAATIDDMADMLTAKVIECCEANDFADLLATEMASSFR